MIIIIIIVPICILFISPLILAIATVLKVTITEIDIVSLSYYSAIIRIGSEVNVTMKQLKFVVIPYW